MSDHFHLYEEVKADRGPGLDAVGEESSDTELARLAKALGHRSRARILRCLAVGRPCTCGEQVGCHA